MRKTAALWLLLALLLAGCRSKPEPGFLLDYRGLTIAMDQEAGPLLYRLGAPISCSQSPETGATVYTHQGIRITTYPAGSAEHIRSVEFSDSTAATREGIRIGSSLQEVIRAYGAGCVTGNICSARQGNTLLRITLQDQQVAAVEYILAA